MKHLFLFVALLLLPGCVDLVQKVQVQADGSVEFLWKLGLNPDLAMRTRSPERDTEFLGEVGEMIDDLYGALGNLRKAKEQSMAVVERMRAAGVEADDVAEAAEAMNAKLTEVEEQITQVKSKSGQDPINFPPQIDNQVVTLYGYALGGFGGGDDRPTDAAYTRLEDLQQDAQRLVRERQSSMPCFLACEGTVIDLDQLDVERDAPRASGTAGGG